VNIYFKTVSLLLLAFVDEHLFVIEHLMCVCGPSAMKQINFANLILAKWRQMVGRAIWAGPANQQRTLSCQQEHFYGMNSFLQGSLLLESSITTMQTKSKSTSKVKQSVGEDYVVKCIDVILSTAICKES
jgi:hypothetical protein